MGRLLACTPRAAAMKEGSRGGQRKQVSSDAVTAKATMEPMGSLGLGWAFRVVPS